MLCFGIVWIILNNTAAGYAIGRSHLRNVDVVTARVADEAPIVDHAFDAAGFWRSESAAKLTKHCQTSDT